MTLTLTCNVAALQDKDMLVFTSLLRLLEQYLTAEWVVVERLGERCDAQLFDVDSEQGREAFAGAVQDGLERIALTSQDGFAAPWLLRKPLRAYGTHGLVEVLNAVSDRLRATKSGQYRIPVGARKAEGLLAALQEAREGQRPAVIEAAGLAALCIAPQQNAFFTGASFSGAEPAALAGLLGALHQCVLKVTPYGTLPAARQAAGALDSPPRPLDQLLWTAALASNDATAPDRGVKFRLSRWPNFPQLPHHQVHLRYAALLTRQAMTAQDLAACTNSDLRDAAAFLRACAQLNVLERLAETAFAAAANGTAPMPSAPAQPLPVVREHNQTRAGVLRGLLRRLGVAPA